MTVLRQRLDSTCGFTPTALATVGWVTAACATSTQTLPDPQPDRPECMVVFDGQFPGVRAELGLLNADSLTTPPRRNRGVRLEYPEELRHQRIDGAVSMAYVTGTNGRPSRIVVGDYTQVGFIRAARDALLGSAFRPGMLGDTASPVFMCQDLTIFYLLENATSRTSRLKRLFASTHKARLIQPVFGKS